MLVAALLIGLGFYIFTASDGTDVKTLVPDETESPTIASDHDAVDAAMDSEGAGGESGEEPAAGEAVDLDTPGGIFEAEEAGGADAGGPAGEASEAGDGDATDIRRAIQGLVNEAADETDQSGDVDASPGAEAEPEPR